MSCHPAQVVANRRRHQLLERNTSSTSTSSLREAPPLSDSPLVFYTLNNLSLTLPQRRGENIIFQGAKPLESTLDKRLSSLLLLKRLNAPIIVWKRGVAQFGLARSVRDAEVGGSNPLAPILPLPSTMLIYYADIDAK